MLIKTLLECALIVLGYMSSIFFIALIKKDNSIVDIAWGICFILIALFTLFKSHVFLARHLLITTLILIWGIRISSHIGIKNWGKPEDHRYANWRKAWGKFIVIRSFFQIFILQGLVLLIVAYPIILINISTNTGLNVLDFLGLAIWCIGFYFEVAGDYQLLKFTKNPSNKGKILMSGLWKYTRHPNYFGEATMWWGIWLIALSVPFGITAIISPLLITWLLLFVSGVPMAEQIFDKNEEYQVYKKRTSEFFPLPPKKV